MSSRLMPPKVGSSNWQTLMISSGSWLFDFDVEDIDIGKALEEHGLAFHDGLAGRAPISPSPSTAVPLLTTATRLPRPVYLKASCGFFWISRHGSATPGVYARLRSRWVRQGLVG